MFDSNNLKNSLKSCGSDGCAIRNPAEAFERLQTLLPASRQPILESVVWVTQAHNRKMAAVDSGLEFLAVAWIHILSLTLNSGARFGLAVSDSSRP